MSFQMHALKSNEPSVEIQAGEEELQMLWGTLRQSLDRFSAHIRGLRGYKNVGISLCICNGSSMDVYNIPDTFSVFGRNMTTDKLCQSSKQSGTSSGTEPSNGNKNAREESSSLPSYSLTPVDKLGSKELRVFFTALRRKMNMTNFTWPMNAKRSYSLITNAPIPKGPGRVNSGKQSLLLMLKLSVDCDEGWNRSVREMICGMEEISPLQSKELTNEESSSRSAHGNVKEDSALDSFAVHQRINLAVCNGSVDEKETWKEVLLNFETTDAVKMAQGLPRDADMSITPRSEWPSISTLVAQLSYPGVECKSGWYIQRTPPDGNCLFSTVMASAQAIDVLPEQARSIVSLRNMVKSGLQQLARAGRKGSPFHRDWLASCIYDIEDRVFEKVCTKGLDRAMLTYFEDDIEAFLAPLRVYVSNWANKIGGMHWGGFLPPELSILSSITGSVIEVLDVIDDNVLNDYFETEVLEMCDTRRENRTVKLKRRDLIFPIEADLPSMEQVLLTPMTRDWDGSGLIPSCG